MKEGSKVPNKPLASGASVAERVFYLSCSFDGEFSRKQAIEAFDKAGYPKKEECFQNLSNAGMTEKASLSDKKIPALYRVTDKGHRTAIKFEKMIERAQRFMERQENKSSK